MPERIQMSRQRPWRADHPDAVKVDRSKKWGNPFEVGSSIPVRFESRRVLATSPTPKKAVEWFSMWLAGVVVTDAAPPSKEEIIAELGGRDLACWCALTGVCHADVLLKVANS